MVLYIFLGVQLQNLIVKDLFTCKKSLWHRESYHHKNPDILKLTLIGYEKKKKNDESETVWLLRE